VSKLLLRSAEEAGLEEAFVQIASLGDFSVTYRIAGLLREVKNLISVRSRLREMMLDGLHQGGIEIVSPGFINQRVLPPEKIFVPLQAEVSIPEPGTEAVPEAVVFDNSMRS
jgi:small conductance mechanosensitive channel